MYYTVKIRQEREWQGVIEADCEADAKTIAHLEAQFDLITDEQTIVEELHEDGEEDPLSWPYADIVYYT